MRTLFTAAAGTALTAAVSAVFAASAVAQSLPPAQRQLDRDLILSGFVMREANTPRRLERLQAVPARRFLARSRDGVRTYVYADPAGCRCAFVGSAKAYAAFQEMTAPPSPPPGYRGPADVSTPSGVNPMSDVVQEMREDDESLDENDIFHPGF